MNRSTLVLILPNDPLTGLLILSSLPGYGYDALVAGNVPDALALLEANRRIGVLVVNADLPEGRGLALAKAARALNPRLAVIYTSHLPQRVPECEKVTGAPCLRIPYHPHQLVGVIGQLTGRVVSDAEAQVA